MDISMLILRVIHILLGIFWVGTALFFVLFFEPTIRAAGPAGGAVMGRLALPPRLPNWKRCVFCRTEWQLLLAGERY